MAQSSHRAELSVGLFLLLGAALVGGLIVQFSDPGFGAKGGYPIAVEVKDATGIRAGVPVRLGGVEIGRVASDPVLNEAFTLLTIPLTIHPDKRIPEGSTVKIDTSGLMGDRFVRILPPEKTNGKFLPEGHRLVAVSAGSLNDLAGEAGETLDDVAAASAEIRAAADRVEALAARLDGEVLTGENLANFRGLLASLRATSENLESASGKVGPFLDEGRGAIRDLGEVAAQARASFVGIDASTAKLADTLGTADASFATFDLTLKDLRSTLAETGSLLQRLQKGPGLAPALLNDPELKRDFENTLDKLERFGFLFYPRERERAGREETEKGPGLSDRKRDRPGKP